MQGKMLLARFAGNMHGVHNHDSQQSTAHVTPSTRQTHVTVRYPHSINFCAAGSLVEGAALMHRLHAVSSAHHIQLPLNVLIRPRQNCLTQVGSQSLLRGQSRQR